MTKAKRKDFYIVPFEADSLGQFEHRLYCHYRRRAVENHGKPIVESMQDISIATGMGVSTISRARKVLAQAGWVTVVQGRPDKVTVYEVPYNVSVATTNVPVVPIVVSVATTNDGVETAESDDNVSVATISPYVGNDSTFLGNKLRDARVENIEIEKDKERGTQNATAKKRDSRSGSRKSTYTPPKSYAETSGLSLEELQAQSDSLIGIDPAAHPTTKEALYRAILTVREYDPLRITSQLEGRIKTAVKSLHDIGFSADDIPALHRFILAKGFPSFTEPTYAVYAPEWLAQQQKHKPAPVIPFEPEPEITESERAERLAIIRSRPKIAAVAR